MRRKSARPDLSFLNCGSKEVVPMKMVMALRTLSQRRRLVLLALVLACLAVVAIPYRIPSMQSRQHRVGIASASALVDTPRSQVADLGEQDGSAVTPLAYRASLLASIMTSPSIKDDIAQIAGVPVSDLIVTGPATVEGSDSPAPSVSNASVSASSPKASIVTASIPTLAAGQLPVIQVNTQARTASLAASLANASFQALQSDVNSAASTDDVPALQRGPGLLFGILGAVLVFLLACGAILGGSSVAAAWRTESAVERGGFEPDGLRPGALEPDDPFLEDAPHEAPVTAMESQGGMEDDELGGAASAAERLAKAGTPSARLDLAHARLSRLLDMGSPPDAA
jgi:hypothetical protein